MRAFLKQAPHGTPLHYAACNHGATAELIELVVRAVPESARAKDRDGYTPRRVAGFVQEAFLARGDAGGGGGGGSGSG